LLQAFTRALVTVLYYLLWPLVDDVCSSNLRKKRAEGVTSCSAS
jgi:hypothetical protein